MRHGIAGAMRHHAGMMGVKFGPADGAILIRIKPCEHGILHLFHLRGAAGGHFVPRHSAVLVAIQHLELRLGLRLRIAALGGGHHVPTNADVLIFDLPGHQRRAGN